MDILFCKSSFELHDKWTSFWHWFVKEGADKIQIEGELKFKGRTEQFSWSQEFHFFMFEYFFLASKIKLEIMETKHHVPYLSHGNFGGWNFLKDFKRSLKKFQIERLSRSWYKLWRFFKDSYSFFIVMNKLKILKDLCRFCNHVNSNQKPLNLASSTLPPCHFSLI